VPKQQIAKAIPTGPAIISFFNSDGNRKMISFLKKGKKQFTHWDQPIFATPPTNASYGSY